MGSKNYKSVYETHGTNAELTAGSKEIFFSSIDDKSATQKYQQSFNFLEIINDSSIRLNVFLDGEQVGRTRYLFGKNQIVILPEENIYFNVVEIENSDGSSTISAEDIRVVARIMLPENS